uniref:Uncharacterized protein n=1 Tax=viral metagenome TaxID=1070528 RepID=A0A6M3L705_9ZZZZ
MICPHCGKQINFHAQKRKVSKEKNSNIYNVFLTKNSEQNQQFNFLVQNQLFPAQKPQLICARYLDMWNKLPSPFKHKRPDTKVYKESAQSFRELELGTFFKRRTINAEWAKKWNLQSFLKDKWESPMILKGLRRLTLLYKEGYWPHNKDKLPHSLPRLLYNPFTNTSMFLMVLAMNDMRLGSTKIYVGDSEMVVPSTFSI